MTRRGFTLIEVLVTIVLVSMVTALGVGLLSGSSTAADVIRIEAAVLDADRRARLAARTSGPVDVAFDQRRMALVLVRVGSGERVGQIDLPDGCRVELRTSGGERSPRFGRDGRTRDYLVTIRYRNAAGTSRICGATGLIQESDP